MRGIGKNLGFLLVVAVCGSAGFWSKGVGVAYAQTVPAQPPVGMMMPTQGGVMGQVVPLQNRAAGPALSPQGAGAPPGAFPQKTGTTAQDKPWSPEDVALVDKTLVIRSRMNPPKVATKDLTTLFFTLWQHKLLLEAIEKFNTRPPDAGEVKGEEKPKVPGIREISIGGIAYVTAKSWTIWLNGKRITPEAIPKEVMDIKVYRNHVDLKWYDDYTNQVYPVRMRSHQRFNLDSRIFLPGIGTDTTPF